MPNNPPTLLIVLDGWGHREDADDNAISQASTPVWDDIWQNRPHTLISGSGSDVGLPDGQMGNSEVGHMNLGAGRVVHQDFTRISDAIEDGSFFKNPVLNEAMTTVAEQKKALHLFGLLSPGGVHSHENHIKAVVDLARQNAVDRIYLHAFLDGRDVPPRSAESSLAKLDAHIKESGNGGIATVIGRYFAMDRDNRWDRVAQAYDLITAGQANFQADDPVAALHAAYDRDESDEFVQATVIGPAVEMEDGDAVIFMNFRADRARQLSRAFTNPDFDAFNRSHRPALSSFVTLTAYASDIDAPAVFKAQSITNSLGEYVASLNKHQLRLAETEKYAHVTFFFSGGREQPFTGEDRLLIPSPNVATYDLQPEMSAFEVTDALVNAIEKCQHELIVCNYANGDMVGHTGNLEASIKAVETIDHCLTRIITALETVNGQCLITADHGNVEQLVDHESKQAHTAHTSELVPLVYIGPQSIELQQSGGVLSDVSPTLLALMKLAQPAEMSGRSLATLLHPATE
jgi:2,3-bisphosphoglycerate-independent phosphoglycerate mutase